MTGWSALLFGALVQIAQTGCGGSGHGRPISDAGAGPDRDGPVAHGAAPRIDVNGDGFDDILVGTYIQTDHPVDVFLGSASGLTTVPGSILSDPATNPDEIMYAEFGRSLASAGDVNGDGYTDVIVGAPALPYGPEFAPTGVPGAAFVYLGSAAGLPVQPSLRLDSPEVSPLTTPGSPDIEFGFSVASVGDVNRDGFADVIVGAPGAESSTGRAYVYLGSANGLPPTPSVTLAGAGGPLSRFGWMVRSAGDVNGDGYDDVLVAAQIGREPPDGGPPGAVAPMGAVYLFLGSPSGPTAPSVTLERGDVGNGLFGTALAGAMDLNGDGYDDVLVVAADGVHVFLGGANGLAPAPIPTVVAPRADEWFGASIAGAGDLDGDGYGDFVVGSASTVGTDDPGRAYVYLGNAAGRIGAPATALTPPAGGNLGLTVAGGGDLDGDGHPDVIFGDYYTMNQAGCVYLYPGGRAEGLGPTPIATLTGNTSENLGYALGFSR